MCSSRILLLLSVVPSLFVSISWCGDVIEISSLEQWSVSVKEAAINNNMANCVGDDFLSCYEILMGYVSLGEQSLKLSDEKKAVVVVGLPHVGKTAFTQFVANESNPLTLFCLGLPCRLIDGSVDGSETVIPRAFLPKLVEDDITNGVVTPFYDTTGFDDTRSIILEAANYIFLQEVIKNVEEIKIVVVVKQTSFSQTETTFTHLVIFLANFVKDPVKFKNSIVLISNFGNTWLDDHAHFTDIRRYLVLYNESLYSDHSPHPDPVERARVESWINSFVEAPTENAYDLQNVAIFRTPVGPHGSSIRDVPIFQNDLTKMKDLIWNRTVFTTVSSDEVRLPLSREAELFLERVTEQAYETIRKELTSFAERVVIYVQSLASNIVIPAEIDGMRRIPTHIGILQNLRFDYCNSSVISSPGACISQLKLQLGDLSSEMHDSIFRDINSATTFLQLVFESTGNRQRYDMGNWVVGFRRAYSQLVNFVGIAVTNANM